ncbi:MAG: YfcE family phosphodiesterase, partial [Deltaproteobacteria bacterium]
MKIGLMADSHDHVPMIERACDLFNAEGVQMVIHAGDYIAPFSLRPLNH